MKKLPMWRHPDNDINDHQSYIVGVSPGPGWIESGWFGCGPLCFEKLQGKSMPHDEAFAIRDELTQGGD